MKIAIVIARTLLGLIFFVFGLNTFLNFIPMPPPPAGLAADFMKALFVSHYLYAVKCFEISGGLILLSGRFTPLGLTLVGPVIVNILFYDTFLDHSGLLLGIAIAALALFLLWQQRNAFAGLLKN
jgi:putative oxidoreductase